MKPSSPVEPQHSRAPAPASIRVALLTASDSRTPRDNEGGRRLRRRIEEAGFYVVEEALLTEEPAELAGWVAARAKARTADAIVVTGGTGIGPRDRTPEAVGALFDRRLPGFGELFRELSFEAIGPAAMLSRAEAGVVGEALVFLLPGAPDAVELGASRLIVPVLAHAVAELRRRPGEGHGHAPPPGPAKPERP